MPMPPGGVPPIPALSPTAYRSPLPGPALAHIYRALLPSCCPHPTNQPILTTHRLQFPTVKEYWEDASYCALLLCHIMMSLVQYYSTISAVYRMGGSRYFHEAPGRRLTKSPVFGVIRSSR